MEFLKQLCCSSDLQKCFQSLLNLCQKHNWLYTPIGHTKPILKKCFRDIHLGFNALNKQKMWTSVYVCFFGSNEHRQCILRKSRYTHSHDFHLNKFTKK